jgi:hypothetical protein
MFESFRNAWRQAVDNFWTELRSEESTGDARRRTMYSQVAKARNELGRLDREIAACRRARDAEREEAAVCARRERMASDIGDDETARVARDYRARHEERAAVQARKLEALVAEQALCRRDLEEMERALGSLGPTDASPEIEDLNRHPRETEFRDLERAARERMAAERLAELKRREGGGGPG